ncbi:hemopexin repeat-containing protein [Acanthopleuribacter pedis]|uniref:MACPF domain-containing protein n=1 Tax=Acanthopleuribacter pedis TaxID=442870 RepID=A0A8J7Q621_9BACT|nr:hemopexin repeat-containing protein [Acanthopleuribacter pedis]MBO1318807.1 hypothetical protein [Acanthopleuribacter pedis]
MSDTVSTTPSQQMVPGIELIGRGLCLWPGQPYELKAHVWRLGEQLKQFSCVDTGLCYGVPDNIEVNPSPPMPNNAALGQTQISESFEHLSKQLEVDSTVAAEAGSFSVDMNASQIAQLKTDEKVSYAVNQNFIPLYEIYIPDLYTLDDAIFDIDIPVPFDPKHKREYDRFFNRFGTHAVKRVWVGGRAMITLVMRESSQVSSNEIRQGLNMKTTTGSVSEQEHLSEVRENLKSNSDVVVIGEGGDKLKLGALRSLSQEGFDAWVASIKDNPKVIEMELVGIWNLIGDPDKAQALSKAYHRAVTFEEISSLFFKDNDLFIVRGSVYSRYDLEKNKVEETGDYSTLWPDMPDRLHFDASFTWHKNDPGPAHRRNRIYFFKGREFFSFNMDDNAIEPGYPKQINALDEYGNPYWPGLELGHIDAAVNWGDGTAYLFSGGQYVRIDLTDGSVDESYPRPLQPYWAGLPFERIDAVDTWNGNKCYFFRDNAYVRFDMTEYRVDPGYPKYLRGSYVEDWRIE